MKTSTLVNFAVRTAVVGLLAVTLSGCATTSDSQSENPYLALYDGESTTAYSTSFPVGSLAEAVQRGDAAVRAGDLDRALYEYIRGLQVEQKPDAETLYKIGSIHDMRNNDRLAAAAYRWTLSLQPQHVGASTGLGVILLETRQYDEAGAYLGAVAEAHPQVWQAHNGLGILADLRGDSAAAIGHYRAALAALPNSALILNNLGYSQYLAGDLDGARQTLERALHSDADYELAWRNLGLVLVRSGEYERAVNALSRTSSRAEAHNDVGYILMIQGDYARANGDATVADVLRDGAGKRPARGRHDPRGPGPRGVGMRAAG